MLLNFQAGEAADTAMELEERGRNQKTEGAMVLYDRLQVEVDQFWKTLVSFIKDRTP